MNPYVIFFSINGGYSFAVANVIMGLRRYSPSLLEKSDIIIFHDGISKKHQSLLKELHANTVLEDIVLPKEWEEFVAHPKTTEWGPYIACKLFGFDLIRRYEKALFLDADLLVTGDISGLFEIEEDIAWREVYAVKPQEIFADILPTSSERILMGNAGLYYFNSSLKKYNIGVETVAEAFQRIKDVKKGGNDEKVMAWLAYEKQLSIKELDANVYNSPIQKITTIQGSYIFSIGMLFPQSLGKILRPTCTLKNGWKITKSGLPWAVKAR